jgi:hypothetical protein
MERTLRSATEAKKAAEKDLTAFRTLLKYSTLTQVRFANWFFVAFGCCLHVDALVLARRWLARSASRSAPKAAWPWY